MPLPPLSHTQATTSCTASGMPLHVSSTHVGSHKQEILAKPYVSTTNQALQEKNTRQGELTLAPLICKRRLCNLSMPAFKPCGVCPMACGNTRQLACPQQPLCPLGNAKYMACWKYKTACLQYIRIPFHFPGGGGDHWSWT